MDLTKVKVTVFLPDYSEKQREILSAIAHGIPHARVRALSDPYLACDIAIVFGLYKKSYRPTWDKQKVLEKHKGKRLIVVDSAFVNRGEYWNVGFGGINGHADFRNADMPADRWLGMGIRSKPWQVRDNGYVFVCGQVPWDTAVQDVDHGQWCRDTLQFFKDRNVPVLFRPHPRVAENWWMHYKGISPVDVATGKLDDALHHARLFVTWNSNSAVDAAIKGVPIIACDPGSGAYQVARHTLEEWDRPFVPSRRKWLAGIGYAQWTLEEMQQGLPWKHLMRDYVL